MENKRLHIGRVLCAQISVQISAFRSVCTHLCHNVATFPAEERLVKEFELESQFAHVVADTKTVGERREPVDDVLVRVRDQPLAERILAVQHEIDDPADAVAGEQRLLVEMNDPVVAVEQIDRVLEAVLQRSRLE